MTRRRALITGATGFVGSHLARRLATRGWDVHLIVRPDSDRRRLSKPKAFRFHVYDGSYRSLDAAVKKARPDVVFHLASLFLASHKPDDVAPMMAANLTFPTQLAEAAVQNGVTRFVNTGTAWQHYKDRPFDPVCLYAATKQAFEDVLRFYVESSSVRVTTLKLFDTYGPDDPRPKLFPALRRAAATGETLSMSPGRQTVDPVFIDDVTTAFEVAADRLLAGRAKASETFAVSTGKPISLRDIVATYARVMGRTIRTEWGGRPYRKREVMRPWSKGRRLPGWSARVSFEDGIRRTEQRA